MYSLRRGPQVGGSGDRRTKGKLEDPYIALTAMITEITADRPVGGLQMVKTHASKPKVGSGHTRQPTDNRVAAHMLCFRMSCNVRFYVVSSSRVCYSRANWPETDQRNLQLQLRQLR